RLRARPIQIALRESPKIRHQLLRSRGFFSRQRQQAERRWEPLVCRTEHHQPTLVLTAVERVEVRVPAPALGQLLLCVPTGCLTHTSPEVAGFADYLHIGADVTLPLAHPQLRESVAAGAGPTAVHPRDIGELVKVPVDAGDHVAGRHYGLVGAPASALEAPALLVHEFRLVGSIAIGVLVGEEFVGDRGEQAAARAAQPLGEAAAGDTEVYSFARGVPLLLGSPWWFAQLFDLATEVGADKFEQAGFENQVDGLPPRVDALPCIEAVWHHREMRHVHSRANTAGVEHRRWSDRSDTGAVAGAVLLNVACRVQGLIRRDERLSGCHETVLHCRLAHLAASSGKSHCGASYGSVNASRSALGLTSRLISGCTSRIELATTKTRSAWLGRFASGLISSGQPGLVLGRCS